jgi:hypothetical protein
MNGFSYDDGLGLKQIYSKPPANGCHSFSWQFEPDMESLAYSPKEPAW